MKIIVKFKWLACAILTLLFIYVFFRWAPVLVLYCSQDIFNIKQTSTIGILGDSYGVYNTLFSCTALICAILTLYLQYRDSRKNAILNLYYKMIEVQQHVIDEISVYPVRISKKSNGCIEPVVGRNAFVEFKLQIKYLLKNIQEVVDKGNYKLERSDIADISYAIFYYGADIRWKDFILEYLKDYQDNSLLVNDILDKLSKDKKRALTRTNQNYLSVYFRNMYNAIKMIDSASCLNKNEKYNAIKVLRGQLSNSELYVLFFNLISRLGKKWVAAGYVERYQLLQNLPIKYTEGYNPKEYFPNISFESEELSLSPFTEEIKLRENK